MLRVLILDPNASALGAGDRPVAWQRAFWTRLGAFLGYANTTTPQTSTVWGDPWDLVVVPWVRNLAASYTNLQTRLGWLAGTTIPCYVASAREPSLEPSITGCSAMSATGTDGNYQSTGIKNWGGRLSEQVTWYGVPPTLAGMSGCTVHSDDGTHAFMWSNTVSGHPVLWQNGMVALNPNSLGNTNKYWRPWYAAQWLVDQFPAVRNDIRTMYVPIRIDGYDNWNQTHLESVYNSALAYGVNEIWLAATWTGSLGSVSPTQEAWLLARQKHLGGLIRATQHFTDLVDGTTGGAAGTISTDGNAMDQYATADAQYQTHCNQMTAKGWVLGSDGFGRGTVNVQNANSMNNAVAHYCAGRGMALWLLLSGTAGTTKLYPDAPAAATAGATTRNYPIQWMGAWPIYSWSADSYAAGGAFMSRTWPSALNEGMVFGGGPYVHAGASFTAFEANRFEMFDHYSTCPDIVKAGSLESMIQQQWRGPGVVTAP
jgi:hypothetical protein